MSVDNRKVLSKYHKTYCKKYIESLTVEMQIKTQELSATLRQINGLPTKNEIKVLTAESEISRLVKLMLQ